MDILYGDGKLLNRRDSAKVESAQYDAIKKIVKEIFENIREMNRGFKSEIAKTKDIFGKKILEICNKNGLQLENEPKTEP
jgi:cell division protein FtsL